MSASYYGNSADVTCDCSSPVDTDESADNIVSCNVNFGMECLDYNCNEGWKYLNPSDSTVTVCPTDSLEEHWMITSRPDWSLIKSSHDLLVLSLLNCAEQMRH